MTINQGTQPFNFKKISYLLIAASFFIIVYYNLNSMLIAGIISFFSFKVVIRWKEKLSLFSFAVRIAILLNILILVAYFIRTAGISLVTLLRDYHAILNKMVSIMSDIESKLPDSLRGGIPDDMGIIKAYAFDFLKNNTTQTINFGKEIFESVVNVILGIVVGGIIAFEHSKNDTPFKKELFERITLFSQSFKKLLEAQAKISAINALFTSIFLLVAIPLIFNATIPFSVAIIIFTFIFGLIPIIGNLISNAIITIFSFTISPWAALLSLSYLIVIHKLEYLLNAKIASDAVGLKAYQIIIALVIGKVFFGTSGIFVTLVMAIYLKDELKANNII